MSAITLATAGVAGSPVAAEEDEGDAALRAMFQAFGADEETVAQILSTYEAMGIDPATMLGGLDPEMLAALGTYQPGQPQDGDADPGADLFTKIMADAMSGEELDESAFMKYILGAAAGEDAEAADAFLKLIMGESGLDPAAFPKVEDAFPKVELEEGAAFLKIDASLIGVQEELAAAVTRGDLDAADYQAILEILSEQQ